MRIVQEAKSALRDAKEWKELSIEDARIAGDGLILVILLEAERDIIMLCIDSVRGLGTRHCGRLVRASMSPIDGLLVHVSLDP